MKRLFDILARMRRLSLTLLLIPSALYLSAEEPTHPFTINASGAQVTIETGTYEHTWNDVSANSTQFLTRAEWEYLLANHRWRFIQRTESPSRPSVYCIVIYPNDYEGAIVGGETDYTGVEVNDAICDALEEVGARFLFYKHAGVVRGYWTTTAADATNGYYVLFRPNASPVVTCGETDAKTATKYALRVNRLPAPSCDCFTVHF